MGFSKSKPTEESGLGSGLTGRARVQQALGEARPQGVRQRWLDFAWFPNVPRIAGCAINSHMLDVRNEKVETILQSLYLTKFTPNFSI